MSQLRKSRRSFSTCHILILCHIIFQICCVHSTALFQQRVLGDQEDSGGQVHNPGSVGVSDIGEEPNSDAHNDLKFDELFHENRNSFVGNSPRHQRYRSSAERPEREALNELVDRGQEGNFKENAVLSSSFGFGRGQQQENDKIALFPLRFGSSTGKWFNYPNGYNYNAGTGRPSSGDFAVEWDLNSGASEGKEAKRSSQNSAYLMCAFKLCPSRGSGKRRLRQ